MANSVRKNTVKLIFGPGSKTPSYLEVLRFSLENLRIPAADIHTIYKDENGGQFYIKFIDETTFTEFMAETDEYYVFRYEDKSTARVTIDQASRIFRYVRIFSLPPEIDEREIQYVLGQYGTIRQHVRERFPTEMNVNIYTGIRGVHMEVSKEIPAHIYIGHFRARIYYEGLKNKCFFCKAEGHVKSNCPKLADVSKGNANSTGGQPSGAPLGRPEKPIIDRSVPLSLTMTPLGQSKESSAGVESDKGEGPLKSNSPQPTLPPATSISATPSTSRDPPSETMKLAVTNTNNVSVVKVNESTPERQRGKPDGPDEYMDDDIAEVDRQSRLKRTKPDSGSEEDRTVSQSKQDNEILESAGQKTWQIVGKKGNSKKPKK